MTKPVFDALSPERFSFPAGPESGSDKIGCMVSPVSDSVGLSDLGCMVMELDPGKQAFPFHSHVGNEEMFIILEGEGEYRLGEETYPVKPGDICAAPKGGRETAHRIVNTGSAAMKYVGISTRNDPDVVEYPDSDKFAVIAISPGKDFMNAHMKYIGRESSSLDYWDGEDI